MSLKMSNFFPTLSFTDYIALFSIAATTLIGLLAVIYARKSYFVSLKNFEIDKNIYKKAEFYIREFSNPHPERKVNPFLKKIASDEINGGVELPTTFTDALITNYADFYFYLVKTLKSTWKSFEVVDGEIRCIYSDADLLKRAAIYAGVYLITGTLGFFLISNFSWYLSTYNTNSAVNAFFSLILIITFLFMITVVSITVLIKFMTIHEANKTLKRCKVSSV